MENCATGDTLRLCLQHVAEVFSRQGGSLRRILFFTIGGTRAIPLMEGLTERFRTLFPGFEGFDCFFYEGVFTVYEDKGASGINVPDIDFGWKGGAVSPEFRRHILSQPDALLEKCIIYDGGAEQDLLERGVGLGAVPERRIRAIQKTKRLYETD